MQQSLNSHLFWFHYQFGQVVALYVHRDREYFLEQVERLIQEYVEKGVPLEVLNKELGRA